VQEEPPDRLHIYQWKGLGMPGSIAMICMSFPPVYSGAAQALIRIGGGLIGLGWKLKVICGRPPGARKREKVSGLEVVRLPAGALDYLGRYSRTTQVRFGLSCARYLLSHRREFDSALFFGAGRRAVPAVLACRLGGITAVVRMTNIHHDSPSALEGRTLGSLVVKLVGLANGFVAISPRLEEEARRCPAWRGKPLALIPNAIDTRAYAPIEHSERLALRDAMKWRQHESVFVFVGVLATYKGVDTLLDAWDEVRQSLGRDARLVLVGPRFADEQGAALWRRAERTPGVELTGRISRRRVLHVLKAADYFILPTRSEGLPNAVIEAMACGLPCIASRLEGITDYLIEDGERGRLVPVGDVGALARAMREAVEQPDVAKSWGRAARQWAEENVSLKTVGAVYDRFLGEVIERKGRALVPRRDVSDNEGHERARGALDVGWNAVIDTGVKCRETPPDVSVGVIYTDERTLAEPLLRSLVPASEGVRMELILVDNSSSDRATGLPDLVSPYPVKLVRNRRRLGYAPNLNRICRVAEGRYVLLMNTDMLFGDSGKCVARMVRFMDDTPECGLSCCAVYGLDGEFAWPARRFQTPSIILARRLRAIFGSERVLDRYLYRDRDVKSTFECEWVSGCFLFLRHSALDEIGLFDTGFLKYFEDVDICERMHRAGWKVMYNGSASVRHLEQRASERLFSKDALLHLRSYLRWLAKRKRFPPRRRISRKASS